ncbi:protein-tyrosine-phosphatase [Trachipleistophora hominis]|uniref:Protein-tyrosine-phosphatase n=1 Tax=Trachipleistophora hominis TaxID=72359 RepID=L7JV95_TRAHO|nr:protein-tyrosine-phosphatase [Trachipleistophora hominis]
MTGKTNEDDLSKLTQEQARNTEDKCQTDQNTPKEAEDRNIASIYAKNPKYYSIFGRLLHYLENENYGAIITELTNLYFDDQLPMTEYDIYCTTPYTNEVSLTYDLPYRINASFIRTEFVTYIACQRPKVKYYQKFVEFANHASDLIVCLCNDQEDYFTGSTCSSTADEGAGTTVQTDKQDTNKDERVYVIEQINNTKRIKFLRWEDFDVPNREDFAQFYDAYVSMDKSDKPVIVHCKAGVGRTGTFILYDVLVRMKNVTKEVFIDELCKMREQRNFMVFNGAQLKWLANIFLGNGDK